MLRPDTAVTHQEGKCAEEARSELGIQCVKFGVPIRHPRGNADREGVL